MNDHNSTSSLFEKAEKIQDLFQKELQETTKTKSDKAVEQLRISYLGRKGKVSSLMEDLRNVPKEMRPEAGKTVNSLRQQIEKSIEELKKQAANWQLEQKLSQSAIDISLPASEPETGSLHPVTLMRKDLLREFHKLGFTVVDGPEIELDFYNFSSLNFQDDHPARDMQDTFFVKNEENMVLRTHTSNIQIHAMLDHEPPLKVVAMGRTYRCDSDLTHTPMFHQLEACVVDRNITMGDMKGVIDKFLKSVYGTDLSTRLRPSYFPFVEPGGEVDLQCVACRGKGCRICSMTGWLEIGGLGMIHPNVFEAVNYDSEKYTGFAFGFGIDRMAMLKYRLPDLRQLFEGNREFLSQFPAHT